MPDLLQLDRHVFKRTLERPDMTLEALFRGLYKHVNVTDDPVVTAFHAFRVGAQLGRDFPAETAQLEFAWKRRAERELCERVGVGVDEALAKRAGR